MNPWKGAVMPEEQSQENRPLIALIAAVAAAGGLLFGFDTGVISGALLFLKKISP